MNDDVELLRLYAENRSEAEFAQLVNRHIGLVYATALRRVHGDAHLAEDITQSVFTDLARKANSLRGHASLSGWLYLATQMSAAAVVRRERRRKSREAAALAMNFSEYSEKPDADASRLGPVLDDALIDLKVDDREAILLRFFQGQTFSEIGAALRITEEAARKRVDRALEKLHGVLARRGITSTAVALGSALEGAATTIVPVGLANSIAGAALVQAAAVSTTSIITTLATHLLPIAAALAIGAAMVIPEHRANEERATEIARLSAQNATIPTIRSENLRLSRLIAEAPTLARTAAELPAVRAAIASVPPPARITARSSVTVTPEGTLIWQGDPITLDEFLVRIRALQKSAPNGEAQFTIHANGAMYGQMLYPVVEARKAGIEHIVIESDSIPDPRFPNAWF